jgi:hypothetical protein
MIVEAERMKYRGVLCFHCRRPIPLSARIANVDASLRRVNRSPIEELGPRVFALRCRVCQEEGLYSESHFVDCDGLPLPRSMAPRRGSLPSRLQKHISRNAS